MLKLTTEVTVFECPKLGFDVDLDNDCLLCRYYVDFNGEEVSCAYDEEADD